MQAFLLMMSFNSTFMILLSSFIESSNSCELFLNLFHLSYPP